MAVKKLLADCEPSWTALRKALEEEEQQHSGNWGERVIPPYQPPANRAAEIVRRHEEVNNGLSISDKGAASTTKKII